MRFHPINTLIPTALKMYRLWNRPHVCSSPRCEWCQGRYRPVYEASLGHCLTFCRSISLVVPMTSWSALPRPTAKASPARSSPLLPISQARRISKDLSTKFLLAKVPSQSWSTTLASVPPPNKPETPQPKNSRKIFLITKPLSLKTGLKSTRPTLLRSTS